LSWSHFVEIIPLNDQLKRDFYAEMCRVERWTVRTLQKKLHDAVLSQGPGSKESQANQPE
jgi:predicted nuclease of restriction endonuclease-like (RecB) superfamily